MDDSGHARLPRWIAGVFVALLLVSGGALAAWSVELPLFAFSPGPVADALDAVRPMEGVEVFPPEGELLMLTVAVQQVNAYEAVAAAADSSVDLVREEAIRREGETDAEYQERQLEFMDISEETAIAVALERLGMRPITDGVEVMEVVEGLPAADVLEAGDVVREVDGRPITVTNDIAEALEGRAPGDEIRLTVERSGETRTVSVRLGESEEEPGRPIVGILVRNINPRFPVEIDSGNVGGPSAGMMYALGVIDLLSEGNLTHGRVVAGTGTIEADGTIGAIGGIRQKVVAAEAAGAEIMLVPEGNYEAALTAPRREMELVSVATIDDALAYLESLAA